MLLTLPVTFRVDKFPRVCSPLETTVNCILAQVNPRSKRAHSKPACFWVDEYRVMWLRTYLCHPFFPISFPFSSFLPTIKLHLSTTRQHTFFPLLVSTHVLGCHGWFQCSGKAWFLLHLPAIVVEAVRDSTLAFPYPSGLGCKLAHSTCAQSYCPGEWGTES